RVDVFLGGRRARLHFDDLDRDLRLELPDADRAKDVRREALVERVRPDDVGHAELEVDRDGEPLAVDLGLVPRIAVEDEPEAAADEDVRRDRVVGAKHEADVPERTATADLVRAAILREED